jgi:hypothetical protein
MIRLLDASAVSMFMAARRDPTPLPKFGQPAVVLPPCYRSGLGDDVRGGLRNGSVPWPSSPTFCWALAYSLSLLAS